MKKMLLSFISCFLFLVPLTWSQNVGIGTTTPTARLHVTDSNVVFSANGIVPVVQGNPPVSGSGRRMMWYADKAAFRSGYADEGSWDKSITGDYSFASGYDTKAAGRSSVAMGWHTTADANYSFAAGQFSSALGESSTALGHTSIASGFGSIASGFFANASGSNATAMGSFTGAGGTSSTAMGHSCSAFGNYATAFGQSTHADANNATAMGLSTTASGINSTAMGFQATASGAYSVAIGRWITANGNYSTALGNYVSTSNWSGAFVIGDNSTSTVMESFVANGFRSRFAGGYRLLTNAAANLGVVLFPDASGWSTISDSRLKENFLPVNGESILQTIALLPLTTWNYKAQLNKTSRHYGPMAQDFYKAFGKDQLGEIGCDTLINQQDFLGVNLIAIQALEKRTTKQNEQIENQQQQIELLKKQNEILIKRLEVLENKR